MTVNFVEFISHSLQLVERRVVTESCQVLLVSSFLRRADLQHPPASLWGTIKLGACPCVIIPMLDARSVVLALVDSIRLR